MIVYRVNMYDPDLGQVVEWYTTKDAAWRRYREYTKGQDEPSLGPEGVEKVEIPNTKVGLVLWLNWHLKTDNG